MTAAVRVDGIACRGGRQHNGERNDVIFTCLPRPQRRVHNQASTTTKGAQLTTTYRLWRRNCSSRAHGEESLVPVRASERYLPGSHSCLAHGIRASNHRVSLGWRYIKPQRVLSVSAHESHNLTKKMCTGAQSIASSAMARLIATTRMEPVIMEEMAAMWCFGHRRQHRTTNLGPGAPTLRRSFSGGDTERCQHVNEHSGGDWLLTLHAVTQFEQNKFSCTFISGYKQIDTAGRIIVAIRDKYTVYSTFLQYVSLHDTLDTTWEVVSKLEVVSKVP